MRHSPINKINVLAIDEVEHRESIAMFEFDDVAKRVSLLILFLHADVLPGECLAFVGAHYLACCVRRRVVLLLNAVQNVFKFAQLLKSFPCDHVALLTLDD